MTLHLKAYVQLEATQCQKDAAKLEDVYRRATWKSNYLKKHSLWEGLRKSNFAIEEKRWSELNASYWKRLSKGF